MASSASLYERIARFCREIEQRVTALQIMIDLVCYCNIVCLNSIRFLILFALGSEWFPKVSMEEVWSQMILWLCIELIFGSMCVWRMRFRLLQYSRGGGVFPTKFLCFYLGS
jgi:hypothetical protein